MKSKKTLILTAIVTLAAIFATTTSFGVAFADQDNDQDFRGNCNDQSNCRNQAANQDCILSDCIQIHLHDDTGDNNVGDVRSSDGIEEGEVLPDTQTLIATPY